MTTDILKNYIIYKIYCKNKEITDEYYGHTCAFRERKRNHKSRCTNENIKGYNTDKYKIIRDNGGWYNWEMVPIEELKNCSFVNAKIREQYHIDLNKSDMNKYKAHRTEEQRIDYNKDYYIENKDKILEKYLENRDTILEKKKEYHLENRDKILEKKTCDCGKTFTQNNKARHERSKFHCQFIETLSH